MSLRILNILEIEWREKSHGPPLYHARLAELGGPLGARKLGYHLHMLLPRTVLSPYHAHHVNEELFVVLGGAPSVRLAGREHPLAVGDLVGVPAGARGAHQLLNRSDRPAHLLAASTALPYEMIDYPDSAKRAFMVSDLEEDVEPIAGTTLGSSPWAPGARVRAMLRDGRLAEYLDGEPAVDVFEREPEPAESDSRVVRSADLPWERYALDPFRAERKALGRAARAGRLGYGLYRLQPGGRAWPFHFHHVNEEFFYVRAGHGRLRTSEDVLELEPGDAFACPPGPEGAHQIVAGGDRPLEYFALSTMEEPEVTEYPDSGKLRVMVGAAPGGDTARRVVDATFRMGDAVNYLDGERA